MARILLCWELGGGLGHLLPIAEAGRDLEQAGHEVAFALRDLAYANELLDLPGTRVYQAPVLLPQWRDTSITPGSFTDILHAIGYRDARRLAGLLAGWRQLFADFQPDVIVHDHSPTAMAAARGLDIPAVGIAGSGFTLPPPITPMPDLRGDATALPQQHEREENVTRVLNEARGILGLPAVSSIGELFDVDARVLLSVPELDAYGPREDDDYWGPLEHDRGIAPEWPEASAERGQRIFVYVRKFETRDALLQILADSGHSIVAHIVGMDARECAHRSTATMTLSPEILEIRQALADCNVVVTHGGSLIASALLAGKPTLTLPLHLEQQITAQKLQDIGAGLNAPQQLAGGMRQKLARLLDEPEFRRNAEAIAARHRKVGGLGRGFDGRFATLIEQLLAR